MTKFVLVSFYICDNDFNNRLDYTDKLNMKIFQKFNVYIIAGVLILLTLIYWGSDRFFYNKETALERALMFAADNKPELEKVIDHYSENPKDSLKLKAAIFLIENMPYHSWQSSLNKFDVAFDSISNYPMTNTDMRRDVFELLLDSIAKTSSSEYSTKIYDVQYLDSNFLIENIDLAFEAWYKYPKDKRADFKTFCNYILPYRNYDEPIELGTRKKFHDRYRWVFDSLNANVPLRKVVNSIIKPFQHRNLLTIRSIYPIPLSSSQYERSKMGICQDGVTYFTTLFRALGLEASDDLVPHWGNHVAFGHNWMRVKYGDEIVYFEDLVGEAYKDESMPKVYRRTFSANLLDDRDLSLFVDVITEYKETIDIEVPIIFNNTNENDDIPVICVFDQKEQWYKVAYGKKNGDKLSFKKMGTNVLYLSAYFSNGKFNAVNYPFFVSLDKDIRYFKPNKANLYDSITLVRKCGVMPIRDTLWKPNKQSWLENLKGGEFQGSNSPSFDSYAVLGRINSLNSYQIKSINVNSKQRFKYVRFKGGKKESHLAKLEFFNTKGEKLTGSTIKNNVTEVKWEDGVYDEDPLTYTGGSDYYIGLKLDKPESIGRINFQARNDDNNIRKGDEYELFYWNESWKSLGKKTATDTMLVYHNTPKNSLLWLRNNTRGKEETAFTMDDTGLKQIWLGFYY